MPDKYLVTSALPYANGPLHIGHLAGAYLPADSYARYLRSRGRKVLYVCGSDEHGAAITMRSIQEGISQKEIVDKYHEMNKATFQKFGLSFDVYGRTSDEEHYQQSQDFFKKLLASDNLERKIDLHPYDTKQEMFLSDRYLKGNCSKCGKEAHGDQCEGCGSALNPRELDNLKSTLSDGDVEWRSSVHFYLKLSKHEEWLKYWLVECKGNSIGGETWRKAVLGQSKSWLEDGLDDRCVTRDLDWGVPVPVDGFEDKVLYVWLDAPIGYITFTKQWCDANGEKWEDYWKDSQTKLVQFIGKDNIVFHTIIFPTMLRGTKDRYIIPSNVPANEFVNLEGDKISTSRNHAVWLHEYLEEFPDQQDSLRYYLSINAPQNRDFDFKWDDFYKTHNSDLAGGLGNFVHRVLSLINKYYDGVIPASTKKPSYGDCNRLLSDMRCGNIEAMMEDYNMKLALSEIMKVVSKGDQYLAKEEPWITVKHNPEKVKYDLRLCATLVKKISILIEPFMPFTSAKINNLLNIENNSWKGIRSWDMFEEGHTIKKAVPLFKKLEQPEYS